MGVVIISGCGYPQGECDMSFGEDFSYDVLKDELMIGDVYVRVYNEQPTFLLEDPKGFVTALLDFIGSNAQVLGHTH